MPMLSSKDVELNMAAAALMTRLEIYLSVSCVDTYLIPYHVNRDSEQAM